MAWRTLASTLWASATGELPVRSSSQAMYIMACSPRPGKKNTVCTSMAATRLMNVTALAAAGSVASVVSATGTNVFRFRRRLAACALIGGRRSAAGAGRAVVVVGTRRCASFVAAVASSADEESDDSDDASRRRRLRRRSLLWSSVGLRRRLGRSPSELLSSSCRRRRPRRDPLSSSSRLLSSRLVPACGAPTAGCPPVSAVRCPVPCPWTPGFCHLGG